MIRARAPRMTVPRSKIFWLAIAYTVANLAHFSHNAEYIAFYPGLPSWMSRESVYLAWMGVAFVGLLSLGFWQRGYPRIGAVFLMAYGLLGVDGLLHYTLALCSEHTWGANLTIWSEVVTGVALACAAAVKLSRLASQDLFVGA